MTWATYHFKWGYTGVLMPLYKAPLKRGDRDVAFGVFRRLLPLGFVALSCMGRCGHTIELGR